MIRYTYPLNDYRTWLKGFAKAFHLKIVEKKIELPPQIGKGFLYAASINQDISYVVMHFSPKEDLVLYRKKSVNYGLSLSFNQVDVSDFFKIADQSHSIVDKAPHRSNIFLSSTNYDLEMHYSKNSMLKVVSILFGSDFVKKYIKKDILLDIMLYTGHRIRNVNKVPISFEYKQLLNEIFSLDTQSPMSNLILQNRILLLTEKFLNSFLEKGFAVNIPNRKPREKERDIKALKEVEEILSKDNLDKFPSIETLSKTAMMSSTKLKTKFKSVYGMKLYEFYNRNRLQKAKEMLKSGRFSVKEVGHDIGFSNLSNFAKAFKKEFGILPNELLRQS